MSRKYRLNHKERPTSKMLRRGDSVILLEKTDEKTWTKREYHVANNMMIGPEDTETE